MIRLLIVVLFFFSDVSFAKKKKSNYDKQQECTSQLIYHEHRSGSHKAKVKIVIEPTFNRAADLLVGGFSATGSRVETKKLDVCRVIHAKGQYQWTNWNLPILEKEAWNEAKQEAKTLLSNKFYTVTDRRFFNVSSLGRMHKTTATIIELSGMVAY